MPLAVMAVLLASSLVLNAQTGVDNYVSASGFVLLHAPSYYTGNDGYCYDFENDYDEGRLLAWTTIDALDEAYPADHFGLAVSTTGTAASDFTMLQEWTMTAKQGGWHEYSVDLNSYVGQDVYIAIRHFNSTNHFCLVVDDIFVGPQAKDPITNCTISVDGAMVANHG